MDGNKSEKEIPNLDEAEILHPSPGLLYISMCAEKAVLISRASRTSFTKVLSVMAAIGMLSAFGFCTGSCARPTCQFKRQLKVYGN